MITICRAKDHEEASLVAASGIANSILNKPTLTVLAATGNSPMRCYQLLGDEFSLDTSCLMAFQLDEYVGLSEGDQRSLYRWTIEGFAHPLRIPMSAVNRLTDNNTTPELACEEYEQRIEQAGGIDLAILGLGPNGHLGFNEPPSDPSSKTRVVALTKESMESNRTYWNCDPPEFAMTVGLSTILAARKIVLIATGAHKADILGKTLYGPVTSDVPASFLQAAGGEVVIVADEAALSTN